MILQKFKLARRPAVSRANSRGRLIVVLGALSAFGPLSMDLYLPGLPQLAADLHASATFTQLTISTCMVGLALGQLVAGPMSDRVGRLPPLLVGVGLFTAASLLCALSPNIVTLVVLRFAQGLGGAAGIVTARAMVRDMYDGAEAARVFSLMVMVTGVAPVLGPVVGSQLLRVTDWRGVFVALSLIGLALLAAAAWTLRETLPVSARRGGGIRDVGRQVGVVLRDRWFVGYTAVFALGSCGLFIYIALSSFVIQGSYGASAQVFGAVFAANAVGIVLAGRVNASLVRRVGPARMLVTGLAVAAAAGAMLPVSVLLGWGLAGLLPPLFFVVGSMGMLRPNATALALGAQQQNAGTASAFMGVLQFLAGAAVAPLASVGGASPISMAVAIAASTVSALAACLTLMLQRRRGSRRSRTPASTSQTAGPGT